MPKSKNRKKRRKKFGTQKKKKKRMPIEKVIRELRSLKLEEYPVDRIKYLLRQMGMVGYVKLTLHRGKKIMRLRPNSSFEETFSTKSQLSYKPQEFNTTYQRASTPSNTMFYGSVVPEDLIEEEIDNARLTAALEASSLIRNKEERGREKITYSQWEVLCDIPLIAIVYSDDFTKKSKTGNEMSIAYNNFISSFPKYKNTSELVTAFLADEFAKNEIREDYDYLISAIFSDLFLKDGLAGVYYPSVRADARGYNVAISSNYVDSCMKLVAAGECIVYKNGLQTYIDNETSIVITNEDEEFIFEKITDPSIRLGEERSLEKVNLKM